MTDKQALVKELWDLAYVTFESPHKATFNSNNASHNMKNEMQFRLMKNLARLRDKVDTDILGQIEADVLLCGTTGWTTKETEQRMLEIVEKLGE